MALKRVLPSRLTGAQLPESAGVPSGAEVKEVHKPAAPASTPAVASNTQVESPVSAPAAESSAAALAAAASSVFSTLPGSSVATPSRVLEDSFQPAAVVEPSAPAQPVEQPVKVEEEKPAPPQMSQPLEAPVAEVVEPQPLAAQVTTQPEPVAEPLAESPATPLAAPVAQEETSAPQPQTQAESQAQPAPVVQVAAEEAAPVPAPAPAPAEEAQAVPQGPTDFLTPAAGSAGGNFEVSRPDDNPLKRRAGRRGQGGSPFSAPAEEKGSAPATAAAQAVAQGEEKPAEQAGRGRVKRQRDFAAATVEPEQPANAPEVKGVQLAPHIPVDSRPLSRVDEALIAAGIVAPPPADSLTQNVPGALAVAEMPEEHGYGAAAPVEEERVEETQEPPVREELPTEEVNLSDNPYAGGLGGALSKADDTGAPIYTSKAIQTETPSSQSDLPWANPGAGSSGWDVDTPALHTAAVSVADGVQPNDFYKPVLGSPTPPQSAGTPPWATQSGAGGGMRTPPEIGGMPTRHSGGGGFPVWGVSLGAVAVAVVAFMLWSGNRDNPELQEKVASWTGALKGQEEAAVSQTTPAPGGNFSMADITSNKGALLPPPASQVSSSAQIDFADVPPEQAGGPIVAEGSETMPEDIGVFAKFQQAVAQARTEKQTGVSATDLESPIVAITPKNELTAEALNEELAAYRKTLTEDGPVSPEVAAINQARAAAKAAEFKADPAGYMDGKQAAVANGSVLPPVGSNAMLPPPELYANNPQGLPIVGEPVANAAPQVRTLADFEVEPFEPERDKVRVPRGLKPKMATTDFPSLEVLSFVPSRGIIAYADGREGVLLLGETIAGWELTNVTSEVAEFRAGRKSHYITAEN